MELKSLTLVPPLHHPNIVKVFGPRSVLRQAIMVLDFSQPCLGRLNCARFGPSMCVLRSLTPVFLVQTGQEVSGSPPTETRG